MGSPHEGSIRWPITLVGKIIIYYILNIYSTDIKSKFQIFHTLLDLPCMSAALELLEKVRKTESQLSVTSQLGDVEVSVSAGAVQNPLYRPLFNFITRAEAGCGDTVSRWFERL